MVAYANDFHQEAACAYALLLAVTSDAYPLWVVICVDDFHQEAAQAYVLRQTVGYVDFPQEAAYAYVLFLMVTYNDALLLAAAHVDDVFLVLQPNEILTKGFLRVYSGHLPP